MNGTNGNDTLVGTTSPSGDVIYGRDGDDTIIGKGGNDQLYGGRGDDTIYGGDQTFSEAFRGNVILYGNEGNDVLYGSWGNNTFDGGDGDDFIIDSGVDMTAEGGAGNDIYIHNEFGKTSITDSSGFDQLWFEEASFADLRFSRIENSLIITDSNNLSSRTVSLIDWFSSEDHIEEVLGNDGEKHNLYTYLPSVYPEFFQNKIQSVALDATDPNWSVQGTGDFNGDGADDILWRKNDGTEIGYWGMGGDSIQGVALGATDPNWSVRGIGDFNRDGADDILWRKNDGTEISYWNIWEG